MATVKLDPAKGVQIPNLTTTERNAISSPETGALIWNTTTSAINQYNGSAWEATDTNTQADITGKLNLSGGTMTGNLLTNSSSKIGIGTASPAKSLHVQGNVLIDNPNNGYGGFRIKDDSGGDYNVYLDTGRNQSGTRIWMRHGARVQGTTPWTDATPSNICSFGQGGIAFGSDTAAANTLDDYEEGSWTPTVASGAISVSTARTYYTKIGRMVMLKSHLNVSSVGSGDFELAGLPYAPSQNTSGGEVMIHYANIGGGSTYHLSTYINTSSRLLFYRAEDNSAWAALAYSALSTSSVMYFTATYFTDS